MKKVCFRVMVILISVYTGQIAAAEWSILGIPLGVSEKELKAKGFKCQYNACEAHRGTKYGKGKKDLFDVIHNIKAYLDHNKKTYKIKLIGSMRFEDINFQVDAKVFGAIAKKTDGVTVQIEKVPVYQGTPGMAVIAIDIMRENEYRINLEKSQLDLLMKYSK